MGRHRRVPPHRAGLIALVLGLAAATTTGVGSLQVIRAVWDECDERRPLVVDLHGYSETVVQHENVTGWHDFADDHDFVVITPHASGTPARWDLDADVATVAKVIDTAVDSGCADPERVYVTGYSMGGFLASHAVCSLADRIAAVGVVAGLRFVRPCEWSRPMPLIVLHGTGDDTVLFDGGLSPAAADALDMPEDGPSIPAIIQLWADRNGCRGDAPVEQDGRVTVHRKACPPGAEVELHVVGDGSHGYPTSANERIWAFFERHRITPPA